MSDKLTTSEAGQKLRYHPDVVRKLCEQGQLEGAYRNGPSGHWRIPAAAVEAFLESTRPRKRRKTA